MPASITDPVVRRLQMARFELEQGRAELASGTDAGAFKAIKSFHDALETFVVGLTIHLGIPSAHRTLSHHLGELEKAAAGERFKHRYVVGLVGDLRDPAKHQAFPPNPKAVADISAQLDSVFEDNALQYLGVSFFGVRLADTIWHERAKRELSAAEDSLHEQRYGDALGFARAGLDMFMLDHRGRMTHSRLISDKLERLALKLAPEVPNELRAINTHWKELTERFRLVELGINLALYDRFDAITPRVFIPGDCAKRTIYRNPDEPLHATRENAGFAFMFALETIRRIEDHGRARHSWSFYRIRAKDRTPCLAYVDGQQRVVGELAKGEEVNEAQYALSTGSSPAIWHWGPDEQRRWVPFDACDILDEVSVDEWWRRKREAKWRADDDSTPSPDS